MPALSHGWWKGWRGPKALAADFRDRGRGFNVLSVSDSAPKGATGWVPRVQDHVVVPYGSVEVGEHRARGRLDDGAIRIGAREGPNRLHRVPERDHEELGS
jgi:hypothetical protein